MRVRDIVTMKGKTRNRKGIITFVLHQMNIVNPKSQHERKVMNMYTCSLKTRFDIAVILVLCW